MPLNGIARNGNSDIYLPMDARMTIFWPSSGCMGLWIPLQYRLGAILAHMVNGQGVKISLMWTKHVTLSVALRS